MLRLSHRQSQAPILLDRQKLIDEIDGYICERHANPTTVIPKGLRHALINESVKIAFAFRIYDVEHLQFFTGLRFEIAPGFFRQPEILAVLSNPETDEDTKLDNLLSADLERAWQQAEDSRDPDDWKFLAEDLPK